MLRNKSQVSVNDRRNELYLDSVSSSADGSDSENLSENLINQLIVVQKTSKDFKITA